MSNPAETPTLPLLSFSRRWLLRRSRLGRDVGRGGFNAIVRSAGVLAIASLTYLFLGEMGVRIAIHAPLLELRDFRHWRSAKNNPLIEYDSLLGWHTKPFLATRLINTLEYGFRSNGDTRGKVLPGGVLAVGSSYTAGSEVNERETWPAQLAQITGWNVNNAGQGGYAADQIIMDAERLLPIIQPRVLVVDLTPGSIIGVKYSSDGWPKPYFTVEHQTLVQHNNPVPKSSSDVNSPRVSVWLKDLLGHLALVDQFMTAFFSDTWFSSEKQSFTRISNDEVVVTCLLLDRLKKQADSAGVRMLLAMQYGAGSVINAPHPESHVLMVEDCALRAGIQLIDEFAAGRELHETHPEKFRALYVTEPDLTLGHKSALGNLEVAKSVAGALALPPPKIAPPEATREAIESVSEWKVILDHRDLLAVFPSTTSHAQLRAADGSSDDPSYLLAASGAKSEHYIAAAVPGSGGTLRFSTEAKADTSSHITLQMIDGASGVANGVMADFDLLQLTVVPWRVGQGRNIQAGIEPISGGWYKLWIAVALPPRNGQTSIVVQVADNNGAKDFYPHGEALSLRHLSIEQGGSDAKPHTEPVGATSQ